MPDAKAHENLVAKVPSERTAILKDGCVLKEERDERKAVAARASLETEALRERYVRSRTAVSLSIVAQIRIASPDLLPTLGSLPHLKCSRSGSGACDEEDKYGDASGAGGGGWRALPIC